MFGKLAKCRLGRAGGRRTVRRPSRRGRTGTALLEMVGCIPLLALILGLVFFFGWAMTNQQHVKIADRFMLWKRVHRDASTSPADLNRLFFQNQVPDPPGPDIWGDRTLDQAPTGLSDISANYGDGTSALADEVLLNRFPWGRQVHLSAHFPPQVNAWRAFTGRIRSRHTREGVEWRRGEVHMSDAVADLFFYDMDQAISGAAPPAEHLSDHLRGLYRGSW